MKIGWAEVAFLLIVLWMVWTVKCQGPTAQEIQDAQDDYYSDPGYGSFIDYERQEAGLAPLGE